MNTITCCAFHTTSKREFLFKMFVKKRGRSSGVEPDPKAPQASMLPIHHDRH